MEPRSVRSLVLAVGVSVMGLAAARPGACAPVPRGTRFIGYFQSSAQADRRGEVSLTVRSAYEGGFSALLEIPGEFTGGVKGVYQPGGALTLHGVGGGNVFDAGGQMMQDVHLPSPALDLHHGSPCMSLNFTIEFRRSGKVVGTDAGDVMMLACYPWGKKSGTPFPPDPCKGLTMGTDGASIYMAADYLAQENSAARGILSWGELSFSFVATLALTPDVDGSLAFDLVGVSTERGSLLPAVHVAGRFLPAVQADGSVRGQLVGVGVILNGDGKPVTGGAFFMRAAE
jgi:hypothetical protein